MDRMRFFRVRKTTLDGHPVWISRTGYTGDLGYEIWCANADALAVWDAIYASGKPLGMEVIGLDALDVARIEAGFVLQGIDYISAKSCLLESRKSTPYEAGLGATVDLDREPFIGQSALRAHLAEGPAWALVGLEISWPDIERLYDEYGLPLTSRPSPAVKPSPFIRAMVDSKLDRSRARPGHPYSNATSHLVRYVAPMRPSAPRSRLNTLLSLNEGRSRPPWSRPLSSTRNENDTPLKPAKYRGNHEPKV